MAPSGSEARSAQLRRDAGRWLRTLRENAGLSQHDLSQLVKLKHYTFVSQLECGRGGIPPQLIPVWADSLNVDCKVFAR